MRRIILQKIIIIFCLCLFLLLLSAASTAYAAVEGFVAKSESGRFYQYNYNDLLYSYVLYLMDDPNGLYEDFAKKTPVAFLDRTNGYIDYNDVLSQYAAALVQKKRFSLNGYTGSPRAKKAKMPAALEIVSLSGEKLVYTSQKLDAGGPVQPAPSRPTPPETTVAPVIKPTYTPLLAAPRVTLTQAQRWAASRNAAQGFIDIAPLYWNYGGITGLRPEILYAQAAHETNFGKFCGQVPAWYNNWAGIKVANSNGDRPEDHQQFSTPHDGVRSHFNHMTAYVGGINPIGELHDRYHVVKKLPWAGTIKTLEQLSGRWAPSPTYHVRILTMLEEMK